MFSAFSAIVDSKFKREEHGIVVAVGKVRVNVAGYGAYASHLETVHGMQRGVR